MQKFCVEVATPVLLFGDTKKSNELGPQFVKLDVRDQRAFNLLYKEDNEQIRLTTDV
jgi:hypothetical protein